MPMIVARWNLIFHEFNPFIRAGLKCDLVGVVTSTATNHYDKQTI